MQLVLVLLSTFSLVGADYECLCNYNVETPVGDGSSESSQDIGTLYEFDCKPTVYDGGVNHNQWGTIAFEHQEGYVKLNSGIKIQTCPGNPDEYDLVTTKFPPVTTSTVQTSTRTTMKTTVPQTETPSTSNKPSEIITEIQTSNTPRPTTTAKSSTQSTRQPLTRRLSSASSSTRSTTSVTNSTSNERMTTTRPTTISTTKISSTTQPTTPTSTHKLTTSSSTSTSFSTTQSTTQTSTKQHTSTTQTQPTSTFKMTSTMTTSTQPPPPTKTTTGTSPTTSISTTQSSTPTTRTATIASTGPFSLGNTMLCPASVRQHAQQKYGILAQYGGSCYNIERHPLSWLHAESTCKQYGGHLLHISSAAENNYIYRLLDTKYNHTVWMGLHDRGHEEHFTWTSGSPVNYTNWCPNRKSNFNDHNDEDCAVFVPYLNHGQWDDIMCGLYDSLAIVESLFEKHPYICQFDTVPVQPGQFSPGNINLCPTNRRILGNTNHMAQYDSSCYEWFNIGASWTHAESDCITHGGHLVQIGDAQEEAYIQQFFQAHDSQHAIWIGLHDRGHEEFFTWTSGDRVSYTNWVPGRKSNFVSHYTEDCVAYLPYKQGQWDDIPCGTTGGLIVGDIGETHPYMCEYKAQNGIPDILSGLIG